MRQSASRLAASLALASTLPGTLAAAPVPGTGSDSTPWVLPADPALMGDTGCFAALTCSDRIAIARIATIVEGRSPEATQWYAREELRKLPAANRTRIIQAIVAGSQVLPYSAVTRLSDADWNRIRTIESSKAIQERISRVRASAGALATELREIRDAGLASHILTTIGRGSENLVASAMGLTPTGVPFVELAESYREAADSLLRLVRTSLTEKHNSAAEVEASISAYRKRIDQLSEQLELEVQKTQAALIESQGMAIAPLELIAEVGLLVGARGFSSTLVRGAIQSAAVAGASSTAYDLARSAHSAYARNDSQFFCELAEHSLTDSAVVGAAIGGLSTAFLGRMITAGSVGVRALGGFIGVAGVSAGFTWVEGARWSEASDLETLADAASRAGRSEDAACFIEARNQQLAGIALDVATLGASYLAGPSPKNLIAEQEEASRLAAEDAKRVAARLRNGGYSENTPAPSGIDAESAQQNPAQPAPVTPPPAKTRYAEDAVLRSAIQKMKVVDDLLDLGHWATLKIRSDAQELSDTLQLVLENPASRGRVVILIENADASAGSRAIPREECERIYQALAKGLNHRVRL